MCKLQADNPYGLCSAEEAAVIEAAEALFEGYTAEDQTPDCWKSDTVLDHRLRELFKTVCALQEARDE